MKVSVKKIIGLSVFILIFFSIAALKLFIIDSLPAGWVSFFLLLAGFIWFSFSKYWEMFTEGSFSFLKKLFFLVVCAVALEVNCVLSKPQREVSYAGTLYRESFRELRNFNFMKGDKMLENGAADSRKESKWKAPEGYSYTKINCGVPLELLEKDLQNSGEKSREKEKLIFIIHGGAYVIGLNDYYRDEALKFSRLTNGASVLNIDYRIAPEYVYPAALEDALAAWNWILKSGWKEENIIVVGDSAGGNLLISMCLILRNQGKKMPDKIICMSPWLDLTGSGESYKTNLYKDVMFGIGKHSVKEEGKNIPAQNKTEEGETLEGGENKKPMIAWYADDNDLYDEYLSPVFAQFYGFPKMLVQVGTWELLQSDSRTLYEKAKAAGVDVTLQEYEGMFHVFQLCPEIIPEVKKAWKEIKKFVLEE